MGMEMLHRGVIVSIASPRFADFALIGNFMGVLLANPFQSPHRDSLTLHSQSNYLMLEV
jgi:flagellar motor component MotA